MRTVGMVVLLVMLATFFGTADAAEYKLRRSLSSLTGGSFYVSKAKGDGVVQLSQCKPFTGKSLRQFKYPFFCASDRAGFRCTSNKTLDVIFVFESEKACVADRKQTLESEE